MKNEIVRKLTSLTLMTIMFAGGLTFAFPNTIPEANAAHNANLYVSAEQTLSNNIFTGPMVIEVVISDSSIASLDDGVGEPSVTINGKKLRMVQATDGNWYAYFADRVKAQAADATQPGVGTITSGQDNSTRPGKGLNFGKFCNKNSGALLGISMSETEGFAIPSNATFPYGTRGSGVVLSNGTDGTATIGACTTTSNSAFVAVRDKEMNVVRENKTLTHGISGSVTVGQVGIRDSNYWPFIQLYDFTPTGSAIIKYTKGGSTQTTTLAFDTMTGKSVTFDRSLYPNDSVVHFTVTDFQLNIDPTDEDSWTYGSNVRDSTSNRTVYYQLFNQTGSQDADSSQTFQVYETRSPGSGVRKAVGPMGAQNLFGNLTTFMFESNVHGHLSLNNNTQTASVDVVKLVDNKDSVIFAETGARAKSFRTNVVEHTSLPLTITETAPNSGMFTSTDEDDISVLKINDGALRGTSATLTYNDVSYSIVVSNSFATISMDESVLGGEWNSGETIPVTLVDNDANLNSRVDEDLDVSDSNVKVYPTITIGSPITLASENATAIVDKNGRINRVFGVHGTHSAQINIGPATTTDTFSGVMRLGLNSGITVPANDELSIRINMTTTGADLKKFLANGTREGTSTNQNGLFHYLNYDLRSLATNTTSNILAGAKINFTIYDKTANLGRDSNPNLFKVISSDNPVKPITALEGNTDFQGLIDITGAATTATGFIDTSPITIDINFTGLSAVRSISAGNYTIALDLLRFGTSNDGDSATGIDRFNDAIYRLELEETGDNTSTFIGTVEYVMLNQLNINQTTTYTGKLATISDDVVIIVHEDLTDEDAVRINYNDKAGDGTDLPIADQQAAPTHSGVVSFDFDNYKIADTVTVTLTDQDLNVDSELIDIFTVAKNNTNNALSVIDVAYDQVGLVNFGQNSRGENFGRLLDITFDDERWLDKDVSSPISTTSCASETLDSLSSDGLSAAGFTLVETGIATGTFTGTFAVPAKYCARGSGTGALTTTTGKDMEVNYVDYRDASGEIIEVGDGAGIRANTGSISLDRTVYPVPFAKLTDNTGGTVTFGPTDKTPKSGTTTRSLFPLHATAINTAGLDDAGSTTEVLPNGDVTVHIRVNDPDFNASPGSDTMNINVTGTKYGPVKIMVQRGNDIALLATAGASVADAGVITNGATVIEHPSGLSGRETRELGPIAEVEPASGIFELDFTIRYTDGPLSTKCPTGTKTYEALNGTTNNNKFNEPNRFFALTAAGTPTDGQFAVNSTTNGRHCILQGDILTVEYTDATDASGNQNTVTDSATFDLRNGVLQSDKSVYIIGSDMILTLIEPDFDRDSDAAETYDLDLIEWDSDAAELTMGDKASVGGDANSAAAFDPEPSNFRETGDSTGIFQIVIEIPSALKSNNIDRGEKIELEYTDWGPSGANFVGEEDQDINLIIYTSNFGATVELDQKVYTWTDKVFITVVAPDHNFDSKLIDDIGNTSKDPLIVQTRTAKIPSNYRLAETGTDTGIFTGEVILRGFIHDANGDGTNDFTSSSTASGSGPTDGLLSARDNDGLTISFEFNEDETVVGSALIRWNIGEVSWLEASYPATGTGVVRIVDPDMNLNPESVDNFKVDVWSDSDAGGIDLTVSETNEATGIFEGTVFFTVTDESSGHRLRVAEGDTITAEYEDNTLPDPYTTADELEITGTSLIGTIVPPLERAPASNARVVDAFGNSLTSVSVDQQVQIAADLSNGQDRDQKFAYLVQIQDSSGVTVSLAWITGSLTAGQSFSPALSWIPDAPGTYTATVFVWESVDNPTALSPTVTTTINVS